MLETCVSRIKKELQTVKHCAVYADELPPVWPFDGKRRESEIVRFAQDRGWHLRLGVVAKPLVELAHCVCGKLLIFGSKVLAVTAHLSAAHLERFWIAHIARTQNV